VRLSNTKDDYGLVPIITHWLVAVAVFGLFGLGLWMTELTYYDPWYRLGPWWHKGVGVMLLAVVILRLLWRLADRAPEPPTGHRPRERRLAVATHTLLYLLLFALPVSGYLISTADGSGLAVFGWFTIPATVSGIEQQEDVAGSVHLALAVILIALAALHALAALKHHFIDKDRTLLRMLGR